MTDVSSSVKPTATPPDEGITSDPIGGLLVPAVAAALVVEAGVVEGVAALGSRVAGALGETSTAEEAAAGSEATTSEGAAETEWTLGGHKSDTTWANQMENRGWTPEQIDDAIQNGQQFPAPNFVNSQNSATRYVSSTTGRYVVRDDVTGEILQIGGSNFIPPTVPKK